MLSDPLLQTPKRVIAHEKTHARSAVIGGHVTDLHASSSCMQGRRAPAGPSTDVKTWCRDSTFDTVTRGHYHLAITGRLLLDL